MTFIGLFQLTLTKDKGGAKFSGTYNSDSNPTEYEYGVGVPTLINPSKTGYTFGGWYTNINCPQDEAVTSIDKGNIGDIILYAKWNGNKYTVTLEQNSATTKGTLSVQATFGENMPAITIPSRIDYTFAGYYDSIDNSGVRYYDKNGKSANVWNKSSSSTLYAQWVSGKGIAYKVEHYQEQLNGTYKLFETDDNILGEAGTMVTATPKNYEGFTEDTTNSNRIASGTVSSSLVLKLYYKRNTYGLTWNLNYGTIVSAIGTYTASGNCKFGIEVVAPIVTKTGYTFSHWNPAVASTMPNENVIYTAVWTADTYTIEYKDKGDVGFSGTHESGKPTSHTYGNETNLKGATKTGYTFGGWFTSSDCSGSAVTVLGATAYTDRITLYAKWTPVIYTITYKDKGDVAFSGTHETGYPVNHTYGSITNLKSATKNGCTFDGWYKDQDCTSTPVTSLGANEITTDTTLYAKWTIFHDYLCFTANRNNSTVALKKSGTVTNPSLEFSTDTDGLKWQSYVVGTTGNIVLENEGDKVYFRCSSDIPASQFSVSFFDWLWFTMEGKISASGNVMSLIDKTCQSTTIPNKYCFYGLFFCCTGLTTAPELPATTLAEGCYADMFFGCTGLTTAPELPATTLAETCYKGMFEVCTGLTTAPELPATTLAKECYCSMFSDCTGLTTAPELPATTLAEKCYEGMFYGCTGLTTVLLPATTLADGCYSGMFYGCTGLITAPELPATTLAKECYSYMFKYCTGLTTVPELPATTLAEECYYYMFEGCSELRTVPILLPATTLAERCCYCMFHGCTGLTTAPELRATTLAVGCYSLMFEGCTGLTTAPELPATTLVETCYSGMFYGCTRLTTAPELPATTLAVGCYSFMFEGCTGLTTAPELRATTLAEECYRGMFHGCTGLTTAPELRATTLAEECYGGMFSGCTGLTTAPELPATTLAVGCYSYMFYGCTGLTTAPELPATTLVGAIALVGDTGYFDNGCYTHMFYCCSQLSYIKCLATDISESGCTKNWLSGVSSTGTFVKNSSMNDWYTGTSGIPSSWTVIDAE